MSTTVTRTAAFTITEARYVGAKIPVCQAELRHPQQ